MYLTPPAKIRPSMMHESKRCAIDSGRAFGDRTPLRHSQELKPSFSAAVRVWWSHVNTHIAEKLRIHRRDITLMAGEKSRDKIVEIAGIEPDEARR